MRFAGLTASYKKMKSNLGNPVLRPPVSRYYRLLHHFRDSRLFQAVDFFTAGGICS
jgi:hypothetical protein